MFARALSCFARRRSRVPIVSIGCTHETCGVFYLDAPHEQVACEDGGPETDEERIDPADESTDPAPREPARIEAMAPEAGVPPRLDDADAVPCAVPAQLVRGQVADVVRVGRAVRDVRPAAEEQPEPVAPVRAVRLHPDERPAAAEHAQALGDVAVEVEQMLQVRVADDGVE